MSSHENGTMNGVGASAPAPSGLSPYERLEYMIASTTLMQVTIEAKIDSLVDLLVAKGLFNSDDIEVMNSDIAGALEELHARRVPNVGRDDS